MITKSICYTIRGRGIDHQVHIIQDGGEQRFVTVFGFATVKSPDIVLVANDFCLRILALHKCRESRNFSFSPHTGTKRPSNGVSWLNTVVIDEVYTRAAITGKFDDKWGTQGPKAKDSDPLVTQVCHSWNTVAHITDTGTVGTNYNGVRLS